MGRPKNGTPRVIPTCHPARLHQAKGLCGTCYRAQWYRAKRIAEPTWQRYEGWDRHIMRAYGLTPEAYHAMLSAQGGGCMLCGRTPEFNMRRFPVDHDHRTGRIRGILCRFCNSKLGWYENRRAKIEEYVGSDGGR